VGALQEHIEARGYAGETVSIVEPVPRRIIHAPTATGKYDAVSPAAARNRVCSPAYH